MQASQQISELVREEMQLARSEMTQKVHSAQAGVTSVAIGAAIILAGLFLILQAVVVIGQLDVGDRTHAHVGDLAEAHVAAVRPVDAAQQVEQRGLARARRAHDGDELAGLDIQVGAAQRAHSDLANVIRLDEVPARHEDVIRQRASPPISERVMRALDIGVNDYIMRPIDVNELRARVRTQLRRKLYADRLRATVSSAISCGCSSA